MPAKKTAAARKQVAASEPKTTEQPQIQPPPRLQVASSKPVRLEVRLNGKVRYQDQVYDVEFDVTGDTLTLVGQLVPQMMDAPLLPPPTRFVEQTDVRDGEEIIHRVHSGRRDVPQQAEHAESSESGDV